MFASALKSLYLQHVSVSVIVNHFVNSEGESVIRPESMVTQDDHQNDEDAEVHASEVSGKDPAGPSRKDIATMTTTKTSTKPRVIKTFISPPPPVPRGQTGGAGALRPVSLSVLHH